MLDPAMQAFDAQMSAPGRGHAAPARAAPISSTTCRGPALSVYVR